MDPMEFTIDNACMMRATRSDPATVLCDPERMLQRSTVDVGASEDPVVRDGVAGTRRYG